MAWRLVVASLALVAVSIAAANVPPSRVTAVMPVSELPIQAQNPNAQNWRIVSAPGASQIVAHLTADLTSSRPFFDKVELQREYGSTRARCGTFGVPDLVDDGHARTWMYRMARPGAGPCAASGGAGFRVVGTKGGTDFSTATVP